MEQFNLFSNEVNEQKNNDDELKSARKEVRELRKEIEYHSRKYYIEDKPEITDYEYDMLIKRLKELEAKYPTLITKSSPTQKVIGKVNKGFSKALHDVPMLSLQDVFSFEDIEEFVNKMLLENSNITFVVEPKIDGLSVSLEYIDGKIVKGSTRGDGHTGEDVTENVKTINKVPHELKDNATIEVRGEVYLSKKEFDRLNSIQLEQDKPLFANPRNAAAGTLRQLDAELVKERNLAIFVFNVQKGASDKFKTHHESIEYCKKLGLNVIPYSKECKTSEEVINAIKEIGELRNSLPYEIDGAAIKVNELDIREQLGSTTKVPRWSIAYKYPPERRETRLLDIQLQVGRTGAITPLAIISPISVAGSTISKTTLHNFDYINQKDIRIGDMVVIQKAGDVIPEVVQVELAKRPKDAKKYEAPTTCPICNEELEKVDDEAVIRCNNSECPAQIYRSILHFASRNCMSIDGMGEVLVSDLIDKKLLEDVADIYYLKFDGLLNLDRFGEKSVINLKNSIEKSKSNTLDRVIFGLNIRHIGAKAAKLLASNFDSVYEIMNATEEEFNKIDEIGEIMATSLKEFFSKPKTKEIIDKLAKAGVNLKGNKKENISNLLDEKTFCITGSFDNYKREELEEKIELNGGKVSGSVSSKTSYLLAGENAGSKLDKANKLNVKVIDINEFLKLINE